MARIINITPTIPKIKPKLRVCAYARVSVEALMQSLSAQVSYYSSLIQNNPEWEYAGVYADEGITGTSTLHRDEFKRLIKDCEAGKIDMILTKSISRFARDTVDCLNTTRRLKELGIPVYFEREKINSMSEDGELMLTLLASFAQEESRSISENIKWATRKKFEQGIPNGHKAPFGYKWDGEMFRIIPEEGEVVKEIYRRYLAGESAYSIAKTLSERGVTGQTGSPMEQTTIKDILSNSSYTGTMTLQKHFFSENHKRKRNKGELPMYLVDDMFEPLVSEEDFEKAGVIRKERATNNRENLTVFSGKVKCGYCGCGVSRRNSNDKKKWVCNTKEKRKACKCRLIYEEELIESTINVVGNKEDFEKIILYNDRIEYILSNGKRKSVNRKLDNAFRGKVWCGTCGSKCERDNWGKGKKVWCCSQLRSKCHMKRLSEEELIKASESLLGENYKGVVATDVDRIVIFDDRVEFDGVGTWQRQ